jgi:hypothetical protein
MRLLLLFVISILLLLIYPQIKLLHPLHDCPQLVTLGAPLIKDQLELVDREQLSPHAIDILLALDLGRKEWIECESECAVQHGWDDSREEGTRELQTRVRVALDQVHTVRTV